MANKRPSRASLCCELIVLDLLLLLQDIGHVILLLSNNWTWNNIVKTLESCDSLRWKKINLLGRYFRNERIAQKLTAAFVNCF